MAGELAGFLFGTAVIFVSGRGVLELFEREKRLIRGVAETFALSFLAGSLLIVTVQLYMLWARVPLTRAAVTGCGLAAAVVSIFALGKRGMLGGAIIADMNARAAAFSAREKAAAAVLIALCAGSAVTCAGLPLYSWDAVATWSLKAKILYYGQAFYTPDFLDPQQYHNLRAYPLFIPLVQNFFYQCMGGVNEHLVKLYFALTYTALTSCVYGIQRGYFGLPRLHALLGTLGVVALPVLYVKGNGSVPTAMVDVPQALFLTCAAAWIFRSPGIAALASACAVLAKNEGVLVPLFCCGVIVARAAGRGERAAAVACSTARFLAVVAVFCLPWFALRQAIPAAVRDFPAVDMHEAARLIPFVLRKTAGSMAFDIFDYGMFWWCVAISLTALFVARPRAAAEHAAAVRAFYGIGFGYLACMAILLTLTFCVPEPPPVETHFAMGFHRLSLHAAPLLGIAASVTLLEMKKRV